MGGFIYWRVCQSHFESQTFTNPHGLSMFSGGCLGCKKNPDDCLVGGLSSLPSFPTRTWPTHKTWTTFECTNQNCLESWRPSIKSFFVESTRITSSISQVIFSKIKQHWQCEKILSPSPGLKTTSCFHNMKKHDLGIPENWTQELTKIMLQYSSIWHDKHLEHMVIARSSPQPKRVFD